MSPTTKHAASDDASVYEDTDIHVVIIAFNESLHLERCILSLGDQCASITVIDSGSQDDTVEIAKRHGAKVIVNPFKTHASQFNFGLDAIAGRRGWVLRIDADEIFDLDSKESLQAAVSRVGPEVDGILVDRRVHFLGRRIRFGGIEPNWMLRLWRNGSGRCEQRWMDEHVLVKGDVVQSDLVLTDINLNPLSEWTRKHNGYASREAIDVLSRRHGFSKAENIADAGASGKAKTKRFFKEKVYMNMPSALRAALYFLYRYVVRLGFLDGKSGLFFHVLQGFWYRTLVDAKLYEIETYARENEVSIMDAIINRTGIDPR